MTKEALINLQKQIIQRKQHTIDLLNSVERKRLYHVKFEWKHGKPKTGEFIGQLVTFNKESLRFKLWACSGDVGYRGCPRNPRDYLRLKFDQLFNQSHYYATSTYSIEQVTDTSRFPVYVTWDEVFPELTNALKKGRI